MLSPGGTRGGEGKFFLGLLLSAVALYFFFDSVRVETPGGGWVSGALRGGRGGHAGLWETTSMGIVFLPFVIGLIALFYDASKKWAWVLTWVGLAIIVIEFLSRIRTATPPPSRQRLPPARQGSSWHKPTTNGPPTRRERSELQERNSREWMDGASAPIGPGARTASSVPLCARCP